MKNLFFIVMVVLAITITSCGSTEIRPYTYAEIQTLIAIDKAVRTTDSLYIQDVNETTFALPIVKVGEVGYYPVYEDGSIIYYPVE